MLRLDIVKYLVGLSWAFSIERPPSWYFAESARVFIQISVHKFIQMVQSHLRTNLHLCGKRRVDVHPYWRLLVGLKIFLDRFLNEPSWNVRIGGNIRSCELTKVAGFLPRKNWTFPFLDSSFPQLAKLAQTSDDIGAECYPSLGGFFRFSDRSRCFWDYLLVWNSSKSLFRVLA